jgi:glycosyltransferase involved in cell wall biosynthesis
VASDIRGCREVIEDGRSGRLFPLKEVDGLEAAVGELLDDEATRRRMGEAARERVLANYTESGTAQRLISCYEEVLARGGSEREVTGA